MTNQNKILVVGTTVDYIEALNDRFESRLLFLTDLEERSNHPITKEKSLPEIVLDLEDFDSVLNTLNMYLKKLQINLSGVACFDCESLALASMIAARFSLPFPALESVMNCRSKFRSKDLWKKNGVLCPEARLIKTQPAALEFFAALDGAAVMKPLSSSGSELVFLCETTEQCQAAYQIMEKKLKSNANRRMYTTRHMRTEENPRDTIVMEQYIPGEEYSCDFILDDKSVRIIRITKKHFNHGASFGTMQAYELPAQLPDGINITDLEMFLVRASHSLGLRRAMAMVDLKIYNGQIYILEMTPRPGGDCLPHLIKASSGFDILAAALDFSEGKTVHWPAKTDWKPVVGLHLVASQRGVLRKLDVRSVTGDPRFVSCMCKRTEGDRIELPPDDYDSRLLGFVLFKPSAGESIARQCTEILQNISIEVV